MEDFIYQEENYIKRKDLMDYENLMMKYDFMPEDIQDDNEYNRVFQYLVNLTLKAPDFLQPYEFSLSMAKYLESDKELTLLTSDLRKRLLEACYRIVDKEDIFNKKVEWGWQENRPLIRGLYFEADQLWKQGEIKKAHELFSKILKTNENDNIGARYSVKATQEGLSHQEFEKRFTYSDEYGSYYKHEELTEWFGE